MLGNINPMAWRAPWIKSASLVLVTIVFLSTTIILSRHSTTLSSLTQRLNSYGSQQTGLTTQQSPIVFAMVMHGEDSAREGLIALKTALMYASRPTEFHIVCSPNAVPIIREKFDIFSRPAYDVRVTLYPVDLAYIKQRAGRSWLQTQHESGYGGLVKIWLHELLLDVDKAIYFDTDMMFVTDPYLLWRKFDTFAGDEIIHLPHSGPQSVASTICSCVMLLNLKEMRGRSFMDSSLFTPELSAQSMGNNITWDAFGVNIWAPDLGDQGLYWAIFMRFPTYFAHLSEAWDISACQKFWHVTLDQGDETMSEFQQGQLTMKGEPRYRKMAEPYTQIFPGIVHQNCQDKPIAWDNTAVSESSAWGPYVVIAKKYKWVWLNRGDGSATVSVTIKENVTFLDELVSQKKKRPGAKH